MTISETGGGSQIRLALTAMITNRQVLGPIADKWEKPGLFGEKWADLVGSWCVSYYLQYGKPPGRAIETTFEKWANKSKDSSKEIVSSFLTKLSETYASRKKAVNPEHALDVAKELFQIAKAKQLRDDIDADLAAGEPHKALARIETFSPPQVGTGVLFDLLKDEAGFKSDLSEPEADIILKYPGAAGKFFEDAFSIGHFVAFAAPEKTGKCVDGDMKVLLASGELRTIRDIVKDKKQITVLALDTKRGGYVKQKVTRFHSNGIKQCWEVKTKTARKIKVTDNHRFFTPEGWKHLSEINIGDFIASPKKMPFGNKRLPKDELRFFAYMLAEGGCTSTQMTFTNGDEEVQKDFEKTCKNLKIGWTKKGINYHLTGGGELRTRLGLRKCSAKTKIIPSEIFETTKEQIAEFLRVVFSCDGYNVKIKSGRCIGICLANETMIQQISHLLNRFGILHTSKYKPSKCNGRIFPSWRISISSNEHCSIFLSKIGFDIKRKQTALIKNSRKSFLDKLPWQIASRLLTELDEWCHKKGIWSVSILGSSLESIRYQIKKKKPVMFQSFLKGVHNPVIKKYLQSPILWDQVESIKKAGITDTYDLAVPKYHNFVCNDVVVHNSWWLLDVVLRAAEQGRNVLYIQNGDMTRKQIRRRFAARAAKRPFKPGDVKIPTALDTAGELEVTFEKTVEYKNYMDPERAWRCVQRLVKRGMGEDRIKLSVTPTKQLGVAGIKGMVDNLGRQGWVPSIVVLDYADLLAPPAGFQGESRDAINENWAELRALAFKACVVTATQVKRTAYKAEVISMDDTADDKRKLAHVTAMYGINQSEEEKKQQVFRLNHVVLREGSYVGSECLYTAGCLAVANPCILSSF